MLLERVSDYDATFSGRRFKSSSVLLEHNQPAVFFSARLVLSRVVCYSNGDCTRLLTWALEVLSRVVCYSNSSAEMIAVSVKHGFNSGSVLLERYRDQIRSFIYGSFKSSRVLLEPR